MQKEEHHIKQHIKIKKRPLITCNDLRLIIDHFFCGACLTLLQLLPDAGDDAQTALQGVSHLGTRAEVRSHKTERQSSPDTPDV